MNRTTITAHAGCMDTPEDSLESLEAGIRAGADICEVDVSVDCSGAPVLKHDDVLPGDTALVPLAAALELIRNTNVLINLDIKVFAACEAAERLAGDCGLRGRVFFTGLHEEEVSRLKDAGCGIPYYLNYNIPPEADEAFSGFGEAIAAALRSGCIGINSWYGNITPDAVSKVHCAGLLLSAWTVDDEDAMRALLAMGLDNITTRSPDVVVELK